MGDVTVDRLVGACGDDGFDGGLVLTTTLAPLAGEGAPVKPAVYEGGRYQHDVRWAGAGEGRDRVPVVVVDNVPSQANRLEAALLRLRDTLGLPDLVLDLGGIARLPVHLPRRLSALQYPHRNADAYLRDAQLDGVAFPATDIGRPLFAATADNATALYEWMPQALLFGFWQSHLGKKRSQAKLPRSWVSEIVGYDPATTDTRVLGTKGDPLNLSIDEAVHYSEDDQTGWDLAGVGKAGKRKSGDSLAELGHGQVPFAPDQAAPAGVSFRFIEQHCSVSFAGLRRVTTGDPAADAAGRALLVALGLVAHVSAFGRPFTLRSGCDLRPMTATWTWLGDDDEDVDPLELEDAVAVFRDCVVAAEAAGLPVGSRWAAPVTLQPQEKLATVIAKTWPGLDA